LLQCRLGYADYNDVSIEPTQMAAGSTTPEDIERNESRWRAIVKNGSDVAALIGADGTLLWLSETAESVLGYRPEEIVGSSVLEVVHPDDIGLVSDGLASMQSSDPKREPIEVRILDGQGSWRHVEALGTNLLEDPTVGALVLNIRDVTQRRAAVLAALDREESFRLLFAQNPQPMWVFEIETLGFLEVNEAATRHYGYSREDFLARSLVDLIVADESAEARWQVSTEVSAYQQIGGMQHVRSDGSVIDVDEARHRLVFDGRPACLSAIQDVTARNALEIELRRLALHDPLTGLPNRTLALDRLGGALSRLERDPGQVALLYVDLDHFKVINDSVGHGAGDRVVVEIAHRIRDCLRPSDTAARVGGDEFVICCEDLGDAYKALEVAERVREAIARPLLHDGGVTHLTASVGIALTERPDAPPEDLLRDADVAVTRAKTRGRDRVEMFDQTMRVRALDRLENERALRLALDNEEFVLHYQPIVSMADSRIVGAEALVRWQHPTRGMVAPLDFIPLAEETGLIVPLGAWIFRQACRQTVQWRHDHPGRDPIDLAVNLSVRQLAEPEILDGFADTLARTGADPADLSFEITESVLIDDSEQLLRALEALKAMGLKLNLDDFGTHYSSLTYVRRFPFDTLKVDQSFVGGITNDRRDRAIVASVIELAHNLDLMVVAEGIETVAQLVELRQLGADRGQGYYLARPAPAARFEHLLAVDDSLPNVDA
jgi:diguanylate cyclase (GGDEF)-like protein/PAS domain S-box-containing protein